MRHCALATRAASFADFVYGFIAVFGVTRLSALYKPFVGLDRSRHACLMVLRNHQRRRFFPAGRASCARISSASARRTTAPGSRRRVGWHAARIGPNGACTGPVRRAVFGPGGGPAAVVSFTGSPRGRRLCSRVRAATPHRAPGRQGGSPRGRSRPRRRRSPGEPRRRRAPPVHPRRAAGN